MGWKEVWSDEGLEVKTKEEVSVQSAAWTSGLDEYVNGDHSTIDCS